MDKINIPESQSIAKSSSYPTVLKYSRGISLLTLFGLFLYGLINSPKVFFVYMTDWGVTLTLVYFLLALLQYFVSGLEKAVIAFFLVIWGINWVITLIFWLYLFPGSPSSDHLGGDIPFHSIPLIASIIEYLLNKIPFIRKYYVLSIAAFLLYASFVLIPYTLTQKIVYTGVTFTNAISYILLVVVLVIYSAALEIGRIVKIRWFGVAKQLSKTGGVVGGEYLMADTSKEQIYNGQED